jgi:hypothetical protein
MVELVEVFFSKSNQRIHTCINGACVDLHTYKSYL